MANNNIQGKAMLLELSTDAGITWKRIGGIQSKGITRDNPVSDSTSQSTLGIDTESEFTGYGTVTIEGSGTVDTRVSDGTNDLVAFVELMSIAYSASPEALLRISDLSETIEGTFNITNMQKNAEQTDLVKFSMSAQNKGVVTRAVI
jgi:predicted secreted protein